MTKKKLVILTGAGISAESGLKTFRDGDGLWEGYNVEDVATPRAWRKDPAMVLEFYNMRRRNVADASPNAAHHGLAALENEFDVQIVTQNIDDLHERAGSTQVLHLHGEIFKMRSEKNYSPIYEIRDDIQMGDLAEDGGQFRPHIVWFEEPVHAMEEAVQIAERADLFAVIGTSLLVYPAASLVHFVRWNIPKFIVDKKIPYTSDLTGLVEIEKPATEGVQDLVMLLKSFA
jgi:NAD-dependent protein deacetylase/lipoamidase